MFRREISSILNQKQISIPSLLSSGRLAEAESLFQQTPFDSPDIPNMFIQKYCEKGDIRNAMKWKAKLYESGVYPDIWTFSILLDALENNLIGAKRVLKEAEYFGFNVETILNVCGKHSKAQRLKLMKLTESEIPAESKLHNILLTKTKEESQEQVPQIKPISKNIKYFDHMMKPLDSSSSDLYVLQNNLESACETNAIEKFTEEKKILESLGMFCTHNPHVQAWIPVAAKSIEKEKFKPDDDLSAVLKVVGIEECVLICLNRLLDTTSQIQSMKKSTVINVLKQIGDDLEKENAAAIISKSKEFQNIKARQLANHKELARLIYRLQQTGKEREALKAKELETESILTQFIPKWDPKKKVQVAGELVNVILPHLKFLNTDTGLEEVAIMHKVIYHEGKKLGIFEMNAAFRILLETSGRISPFSLPMLVPPRLWLTVNSGGFLNHPNSCVKLAGNRVHGKFLEEADRQGKLEMVLESMDILGKTRWRINKPLLEVMKEAWNNNLEIGHIVAEKNFDIPELPTERIPEEEFKQLWLNRNQLLTQNQGIFTQRCDTNYKLAIAEKFKDRVLYFPHNMDFRGRAYPMTANFSHMGSDVCRSLLKFDETKVLGEEGVFWLKVHLANMFGFDKHSFEDRVKFCETNFEQIEKSATLKLEYDWWKQADYPWQCLAACMELVEALKVGVNNFASGLPVQMDGSCNGLQHYAALGRDTEGAMQVNLVKSDKPQDVYSKVAEIVSKQVVKDAPDIEIANILVNKVCRKVVKRPIMTSVYGVTPSGARMQILDVLKDMKLVEDKNLMPAAKYISEKIREALCSLFVNSKKLQSWLTQVGTEIAYSVPKSKIENEKFVEEGKIFTSFKTNKFVYPCTPIVWTTPLGFPVLQPYSNSRVVQLRTSLQQVSYRDPCSSDPTKPQSQVTGIPPNFIHSLDACHMMMTALGAHRQGIEFASVHDSFWTLACDIPKLNKIIREEFVNLHSNEIMQNTLKEFKERYKDHFVPVKVGSECKWRPIDWHCLPPKGEFDLQSVKESKYFFS